ncbi:MAG TPA: BtaA family protein [Balneolaceae bacterium]|nr:BtaA family protein [Balneolaceae bacterium]
MKKLSNIVEHFQQRLFRNIVSNKLVYNTCWEDPRIDRQLLHLDSESSVVMLTSAGGNALDYLLDDPKTIHCVDTNPAQNALLDLKKALLKRGNYSLLWDFFGEGRKDGAEFIYGRQLKRFLSPEACLFWDEHISYFTPSLRSSGFYFRGTSGKVARMIYNRIQRKGLYPQILKLLKAESRAEQAYYFDEIEPHLWTAFHKWLMRQRPTMAMLGVPAVQLDLIDEKYDAGLPEFIRKALRHVFTEIPIHDNYFWRVYLTGSYSKDCCPNYLLKPHFEKLHKRVDRINTHTSTLLDFLKQHPGQYSHFVLLDHQDWMANGRNDLLAEEWKHILANSKAGARILFRSAGNALDFLPDFVFEKVAFQPKITADLHQKDRVGTYETTHLGIVQ